MSKKQSSRARSGAAAHVHSLSVSGNSGRTVPIPGAPWTPKPKVPRSNRGGCARAEVLVGRSPEPVPLAGGAGSPFSEPLAGALRDVIASWDRYQLALEGGLAETDFGTNTAAMAAEAELVSAEVDLDAAIEAARMVLVTVGGAR